MNELKLNYPMFMDQVAPKGHLSRDKRCHALWYFAMLAQKCKAAVGKGPESQILVVPSHDEGAMLWMDKRYEQIARSVATLYGLSNPGDYWGWWPWVEQEAQRLGIEIHPEIRNFAPGKIIIT